MTSTTADASGSSKGARPEPQSLTGVLDDIAYKLEHDDTPHDLTVEELLDSVGRRSYGPLLLVIGLFTISPATIVPGLTWFAAALTLLVAGQMALGRRLPWLPKKWLKGELPRAGVLKGLEKGKPFAARVDALLKPRLVFLARPPFVNLVALLCIAAALATFPLGFIPFAPLAPGLAVVFFGLGMTARDGLWLMLGAASVTGALWLAALVIF